jgi:hypothetical protein
LLERIEKLESDNIIMNSEFEGKIVALGRELGGFKETYLKKSVFEDWNSKFKEMFTQEGQRVDAKIKLLVERVEKLEEQMPVIETRFSD